MSFSLRPGEVFGFLGPNGAGKTTAIRTITGFMQPTSGSFRLLGASDSEAQRKARARVGYLAGDIALYGRLTGRQLLKYLAKLGRDADWQYVAELERRFEAELDKPIRSLSKGNRQKLGVIQAFMHRPKLAILDEPTSGLDPLMKQVFYEIVRESSADKRTIFVSSHDLSEVQKICDRAGFIRNGKLISVETIAEVMEYSTHQYIVEFAKKPAKTMFDKVDSVQEVHIDGRTMTVTVRGEVGEFVRELAKHKPVGLREHELELEELFMHHYTDKEQS